MTIWSFLRCNLAAIVLLASFSGCTGVVFYPMYMHTALNARRSQCQSQLKSILMACLQYQQDYDGKSPPLSGHGSRGWPQLIARENSSLSFSCPAGYGSSFSPTSDYFFNARLASRKEDSVHDLDSTIVIGDGPDNGPSNSHYWELPNDGANPSSPFRRHVWGTNVGFADGHVKTLPPEHVLDWHEDDMGHTETHYKFSPDEKATRRMR